MPTPSGLPKVGEFLVWPDGTRRKVLERTSGDLWAVRYEDSTDLRGYRWLLTAALALPRLNIRIEK